VLLSNFIRSCLSFELLLFYCIRVSTSCISFFKTKTRKIAGYRVLYHFYKIFNNLALFIWNILCLFFVTKTRKNINVTVCLLNYYFYYYLRVFTSYASFFSTKTRKMVGYWVLCYPYKIFSNLALFIWNIFRTFYLTSTSITIKFYSLPYLFWTFTVLLFKIFYFMCFMFSTKTRKMKGYEFPVNLIKYLAI